MQKLGPFSLLTMKLFNSIPTIYVMLEMIEVHAFFALSDSFFWLPGLPSEHGRSQILRIHTTRMQENGKLTPDFDINELAASTKNFSGAEIEGLVRAATSTAMNRLVKV